MALIMKNMLFAIVFYIFALKIIALPSEKEEKLVGLTDEEPANRHASERKRNLFILPSEKEENIVNCASECIRPQM